MSTHTVAPSVQGVGSSLAAAQRARSGLVLFAVLLIPLSLFGYWFYINNRDLPLFIPSLPLSLAPGLASILTRLVRREGFGDVSFRLRGPRMGQAVLVAFGLPLVTGIIAYGSAVLLGLATFNPPPFPVAVSPAIAQFGVNLLFTATLGILLLLPTTGGEEIGWRGYLLPRLVDARIPYPVLLSSLIWGAWHLPVVFAGVYAAGSNLLVSAVLLMLATLAVGSVIGWIRLTTGSVLPCILAHAAWNALINGGFTPATSEGASRLWTGESGILVVLALIPITLLLRQSWRPAPKT